MKRKMKNNRLMGLFSDFDEAHDTIASIRRNAVPGLTVDEVDFVIDGIKKFFKSKHQKNPKAE